MTRTLLFIGGAAIALGVVAWLVLSQSVDGPRPGQDRALDGAGPTPIAEVGRGGALDPVQPIATSRFFGAGPLEGRVVARIPSGPQDSVLLGSVADPAGRAVRGVEVRLMGPPQRAGFESSAATVARLRTDEGGLFAFVGLDALTLYTLQADHPDFQRAKRGPIERARPETLLQELVLEPGLFLAGQVTDDRGQPIEGAELSVHEAAVTPAGTAEERLERATKTDADGRYRVTNLAIGMKRVLVRSEGRASAGRPRLDVRASIEALDFRLGLGLSLLGEVVDQETGQPIVGALVTARPLALEGLGAAAATPAIGSRETGDGEGDGAKDPGREPAAAAEARERFAALAEERATTGEDGRFRLDGLAEASYLLRSEARGYQISGGYRAIAGGPDTRLTQRRCPVVRGRVVEAASGRPVTAFRLSVVPNETATERLGRGRQEFTDAEGHFAYAAELPGRICLLASAPGFSEACTSMLNLAPGKDLDGVEIRLPRGATVRGRVVDAQGKPVSGAGIQTKDQLSEDPGQRFVKVLLEKAGGAYAAKSVTDADGRFELTGVRAGEWMVEVVHARSAPTVTPPFLAVDGAEVDLGEIRLSGGATLRGLVRNAEGGAARGATISLANVDLSRLAANKQGSAAEDGRYEISGIAAGTYRITVIRNPAKPDFGELIASAQRQLTVTLADGETKEFDL